MSKYLIVGLGNIGIEYVNTRHNIGFDVVEALASKHGSVFKPEKLASVAEIKYKGRIIICIKPSTYMNLSGRAFRYYFDRENIAIENTLTVVDDLALPLSRLRLRGSGSNAGHNGLKDIQAIMGTDAYPRLKFGIGSNYAKGSQVNFVLGNWQTNEIPIVKVKIDKCIEAIESFVFIGLSRTMNMVNNLEFV